MPQFAKPRRVPLLWLLVPFAIGIVIARHMPALPQAPLVTAALACLFIALWSVSSSQVSIWRISFPCGALLLGVLRFSSATTDANNPSIALPRETAPLIRIETLFGTAHSDAASGIASILIAPEQQRELEDRKVFFFLDTASLNRHPLEGETYRSIGVIRPLSHPSEGDRFDAYLRNLGIAHTFKQGYFIALHQGASGPKAFFNNIQNTLARVLSENKRADSPLTGAYKGLMLGQKSELSPEQKELFLANGTMHLFAISGLHIGVIAVCFHQLLGLIGLKSASRSVASIAAVTLFVLITGGSASSWRALLMIACFYLSSNSKRQTSPLNALALSALIYLLIGPRQLFQAGFQMSYLTVAAILMFGLPLARSLNEVFSRKTATPYDHQGKFRRYLKEAKTWVLGSFSVSLAAFLTSSILGMYYFQILPTYGVLVNLIALPAASLAIIAGFIAIILSPLNSLLSISELFNNAALVLIYSIHEVLIFTRALPLASVATEAISPYAIALSLTVLFLCICLAYVQRERPGIYIWQGATILLASLLIVALG